MANVDFIRGNEQKINDTPIVDGQLLFDTDNETILMDNGTERQNFGGGRAENVSYDNTTSGLEGTNLQATTDEIADDLKRVPAVTDAIEDVGDIAGRDADTLGGRITASNIDTMQNEINEINDNLGGYIKKYTYTIESTIEQIFSFGETFATEPLILSMKAGQYNLGTEQNIKSVIVRKTGFTMIKTSALNYENLQLTVLIYIPN